jgi:hypothetical protein
MSHSKMLQTRRRKQTAKKLAERQAKEAKKARLRDEKSAGAAKA